MRNWTLHHADCRDILPTIPNASIHAAIFDPPYPHIKRDYGTWTEDEWFSLMQAVVPQLKRVLVPLGSAVIILQPNSEHIGSMRPWLWKFMAWACKEWNVIQDVYWHNTAMPPTRHCNRKYGLMRPAVKTCVWLGSPDAYRNQDEVLIPLSKSSRRALKNGRGSDDTLRYSPSRLSIRWGRACGLRLNAVDRLPSICFRFPTRTGAAATVQARRWNCASGGFATSQSQGT